MQTEITIDVAGFRQVLGQLKGAISPKTPLPILQCVKLSFDRQAEVFRLTGSNSELWLTVDCTTNSLWAAFHPRSEGPRWGYVTRRQVF